MEHKYSKAGRFNAASRTAAPADVRLIVTTAMFAALTLLATSVLKIQTPTFGYIHLGDAFVLLAGFFLGPVYGGLAAGIGSALSDLLGGYVLWVPGTFAIKYLSAAAAALVFRALTSRAAARGNTSRRVRALFPIPAGVTGELIMVAGYFFYNILVIGLSAGQISQAGFASAFSLAVAGLPFNIVQGASGILLAVLLQPVFNQIQKYLPTAP